MTTAAGRFASNSSISVMRCVFDPSRRSARPTSTCPATGEMRSWCCSCQCIPRSVRATLFTMFHCTSSTPESQLWRTSSPTQPRSSARTGGSSTYVSTIEVGIRSGSSIGGSPLLPARDSRRLGDFLRVVGRGKLVLVGEEMAVRLRPVAARNGDVELGVAPHAVLGHVQTGGLDLGFDPDAPELVHHPEA